MSDDRILAEFHLDDVALLVIDRGGRTLAVVLIRKDGEWEARILRPDEDQETMSQTLGLIFKSLQDTESSERMVFGSKENCANRNTKVLFCKGSDREEKKRPTISELRACLTCSHMIPGDDVQRTRCVHRHDIMANLLSTKCTDYARASA